MPDCTALQFQRQVQECPSAGAVLCWRRSAEVDELSDGEPGVAGYEAQQVGVNVAAAVDRDGSAATVGVREPLMGASLANFAESEGGQDRDDLAWPENGNGGRCGSDVNRLDADEVCLEGGFAVFKDEREDFCEVGVELVE